MEGVRYIEMHRGPCAYVLGPPPSRGRDLELEGGVDACHFEMYTSPETPTCEVPSNGVAYCLSVLVKLRFTLGPVSYPETIALRARK